MNRIFFRMALASAIVLLLLINGSCRRQAPQAIAASGSMEPSLPGPIHWIDCERCKVTFGTSSSAFDPALPVRCIHCSGPATVRASSAADEAIDIQPLPASSKVHVGETIVFQLEQEGKGVKRVAGLPHEHVEILDGDLWRDGRRQTKDLDSFLRSAILVDALHEVRHPMPKWVGHRENQRPRTASDLRSEEWYRFVPDPSFPETVPQSITDDYWMNQGERLHPIAVSDFGVVLEVEPVSPQFTIDLELATAQQSRLFRLQIEADQVELRCPTQESSGAKEQAGTIERRILPFGKSLGGSRWVAIAFVDGLYLVGAEGHQLVIDPKEWPSFNPWMRRDQPLALRATGERIRSLSVVRDLYYRASSGRRDGELCRDLPGYAVLGDNVSISDDSRLRFDHGIERGRILGKVVPSPNPLKALHRQRDLYFQYLK